MAEIELVITDLDGTFCEDTFTIPRDNRNAVMRMKEEGIPVCACTGRNWSSARPVVTAVGLDDLCAICNGAAVVEISTGELRHCNRLSPEVTRRLIKTCMRHDLCFVGHTTRETPYYMPMIVERFRHDAQEYEKGNGGEDHIRCETVEKFIRVCEADLLMLMVTRRDLQLPDDAAMADLYACGDIEVTSSESGELQIMAGGATKEAGARILANLHDVPASRVLALGDNENDVSMLRWAGVSAAVENAKPMVKEAADHIAASCGDGGAGQAILHLVLGE